MMSSTSSNASSDSPMKNASKNGVSGAGFEADGPPATTIGSPSPRPAARGGMPARSSTSSTFEHVRVRELRLERDAEQVDLAHRPPRLEREERQSLAAHRIGHVGPRAVDP